MYSPQCGNKRSIVVSNSSADLQTNPALYCNPFFYPYVVENYG